MLKKYHVQYANWDGEWTTFKKCFTFYGARKRILKTLRNIDNARMWRVVLVAENEYIEKVLYGIYVQRCNAEYINRIFNAALKEDDEIWQDIFPHAEIRHKSLIG